MRGMHRDVIQTLNEQLLHRCIVWAPQVSNVGHSDTERIFTENNPQWNQSTRSSRWIDLKCKDVEYEHHTQATYSIIASSLSKRTRNLFDIHKQCIVLQYLPILHRKMLKYHGLVFCNRNGLIAVHIAWMGRAPGESRGLLACHFRSASELRHISFKRTRIASEGTGRRSLQNTAPIARTGWMTVRWYQFPYKIELSAPRTSLFASFFPIAAPAAGAFAQKGKASPTLREPTIHHSKAFPLLFKKIKKHLEKLILHS